MSIDEQIIYYYRNGWSRKEIAEKLGITHNQVMYRLQKIRQSRPVKRWWEEQNERVL